MKYYETVVIIHPAIEGGMLKDSIVEVQKLVEQKGGELKNTEVWGRKKLAYLIDKQKYGTYTMLQFIGDKIKINEMNVELEHNPNVLAYMTIKIDETEMREQTGDLDTQIDGQAPQAEAEETVVSSEEKTVDKTPEVSEDETKAIIKEEGDDLPNVDEPETPSSDESEDSQDKEN